MNKKSASLEGRYYIPATGENIIIFKEKRGNKTIYRWHTGFKLFARDIGSEKTLRAMIKKGQLYKCAKQRKY
jgi:hypothetical protein